MANKQILILEELGISRKDFQALIDKNQIQYDLVWGDNTNYNQDSVEGIITIKTKVDAQLIMQYPNLKFVAVAFTGYDCVDISACTQNNIAVFNVPTYSTDSVAELTLGLTISLLREIPQTQNILHHGNWAHQPGLELKGKTIGIIGTGNIGLRVAELFSAFGCKLLAWSRSERIAFTDLGGIYVNSIEELASKVDILCVHIPQTEESINLIDANILNNMKASSYLINTARGPIVNQNDLSEALNNNQIAGAAIDVFNQEPINKNAAILKAKNTILTPHIAYKTEEALLRRASITIDNISSFAKGTINNQVNL
jgi:D-3-phosphoglycerate dehydrogenase